MTSVTHWKAIRRMELDSLTRRMGEDAVAWHRSGQCNCMKGFEGEITTHTFLPCPHLRDAQWKKYKKEVRQLEKAFSEYWSLKLAAAFTDEPSIEFQ